GTRLPARDGQVARVARARAPPRGAGGGGAGVTELERQLTRLGRELDWPPTPNLTLPVMERVGPTPRVRRRPILFRRSFAIALAALLVVAGGVFAAVPGVRHSVLEFFGLRGATVERRRHLPPAPRPRPPAVGERTT